MTFQHPALRKAPVLAGLFALLLWLPGCPLSPDSDEGGGGPDNTIAPERTTVDGAIALFEFVWAEKRIDLYQELLHNEYEYIPQSEDLIDFPWLQGQPWDRTDELGIATNMFDPSFVSSETSETIDTIDMDVSTLSSRPLTEPAGAFEVTTTMLATVLWAADTGATSEVRMIFVLVPDPNDNSLWQIIRQQELPLL